VIPGSVRAMVVRDVAIELSYQFQLALRVVQVVFISMSLYFVSKLVDQPEALARYGGDYFEFSLTGMIVLSFASLGLVHFSRHVSEEQRLGTFEVVLTTPARPGAVLLGSLAVPFLITVVQIATYLTVAIVFFGADIPLGGLALAVPVLALTALSFCAIGIFSAAFIVLTKRGDPITALAAQLTTFFAGTLFPVSLLPGPVQAVSRLFPAYHGLEGVRSAMLTGAGIGDVAGDLLVLTLFAAVLLPAAFGCYSWALSTARTTGTLATY
jgi:ABC-2 type transport system permease protein